MNPIDTVRQLNLANRIAVVLVTTETQVRLNKFARGTGRGADAEACPYTNITKHGQSCLLIGVGFNDLINVHNKVNGLPERIGGGRSWGENETLNIIDHNGKKYLGGVLLTECYQVPAPTYTMDGQPIAHDVFERFETAKTPPKDPIMYVSFGEDSIINVEVIDGGFDATDTEEALERAYLLAEATFNS